MDMANEALWKEKYKIGNELIDSQHRGLFENVERLLQMTKSEDISQKREEIGKLIDFLVDYTVKHFSAEEKYQEDIRYVSRELHKKIHENFTNTVIQYKRRLEKDFCKQYLSDLTGTLLTWLVFHVLACDSKIPKNEPIGSSLSFDSEQESVKSVVRSILTGLYGIPVKNTSVCLYKGFIAGDCFVRTVIHGKKDLVIIYGVSKSLAVEVFKRMSGMDIGYMEEPDELAKSAFLELGSIFSTYISAALAKDSSGNMDITQELFLGSYTDKSYKTTNSILFEITTDFGNMEILLSYI